MRLVSNVKRIRRALEGRYLGLRRAIGARGHNSAWQLAGRLNKPPAGTVLPGMPRLAAIVAMLTVALLLIAAGIIGRSVATRRGAKLEMNTEATSVALPLIDLRQPATFETATFALG